MSQDRRLQIGALWWLQRHGVHTVVGDSVRDRRDAPVASTPSTETPRAEAPRTEVSRTEVSRTEVLHTKVSVGRAEAEQAGQALAAACETLDDVRRALVDFEGCGLKETAHNLCFYRGVAHAQVMIIGEAPGAEEDRQGQPFVGKSGQLLDSMLRAAGLDVESLLITNTVFWRPPGNRTPSAGEIAVCRPFLNRTIELVAPAVIVTAGGPAAQTLLETSAGITGLRGRWHGLDRGTFRPGEGEEVIPVLPIFHPAYLLRQPRAKRLAWRDMLVLRGKVLAIPPRNV